MISQPGLVVYGPAKQPERCNPIPTEIGRARQLPSGKIRVRLIHQGGKTTFVDFRRDRAILLLDEVKEALNGYGRVR